MSEKARSLINSHQDRLHLRSKTTFILDRSPRMLIPRTDGMEVKDFTVAETPPLIKMMIVPGIEPAYLPDNAKESLFWSNWNPPARTEDGRYIFAIGDCRSVGGKIYLYEYNPMDEKVKKVLSLPKLYGWSDSSQTDGKLHGKMRIMDDGNLWTCSKHELTPDVPWIYKDNKGSRFFSLNVNTNEAKDWGVLFPYHTFTETVLDTKRGLLFASGVFPGVLCYDVRKHATIYADSLPNGWRWYSRTVLLDDRGIFWGTDAADSLHRFLSFDPVKKKFARPDLSPSENTYYKKIENIRACTDRRACDGAYWCITYNGAMFRFRPEVPSVEPAGVNWDRGRYTSTIAMDPTGRYLYYMPGDTRMYNADTYGPIVLYDVKTGQKKVLAWLVDYYYEKYGYWVGGTYGMEISADGSFLVIVMNGAFRFRDDAHDNPYEFPSLFVVEIPESERMAK